VRAWEYDPDLAKKQKMVWMTTMHVDDPEHRDLNEISTKMLAAGAHYFDRRIGVEKEVVVAAAVPEGHVKVGTPEVVAPAKPKTE
jgi:hypothetical protein